MFCILLFTECENCGKVAYTHCSDCGNHYCQVCSTTRHGVSHRKNHKITRLSLMITAKAFLSASSKEELTPINGKI